MKNHLRKGLLLGSGLGLLCAAAACAPTTMTMRYDIAQRLAAPAWMVKREIPAAPFSLTAYERMHERFAPATIYIEGDGLAWMTKNRKSLNPTPTNPVALHLATKDHAENLVWLGRPCQYSGMLDEKQVCDDAYWTDKRFSPEVIEAYNTALNEIKKRYDIEGFNLVGFSGGGAIAAILAAERPDVLSLRTVAGNVDHRAHSAYHHVSPLSGSLNPPEFAEKLSTIPQYHYIGGQDEIVPPAILHSYLQALGASNCVNYKFVQEAAHDEGWVDKWPELLKLPAVCQGPVHEFDPAPFEEMERMAEPTFNKENSVNFDK